MLTTYVKIIGLIAALSVFSGCGMFSQRETMLDRNWGTSLETAKQGQTLNPEAGKNLDPVVGFDGRAAEASMMKYRGITEKVQVLKGNPYIPPESPH
ncbi:hypothetical protein ES703_99226 [subsurface metagenome]